MLVPAVLARDATAGPRGAARRGAPAGTARAAYVALTQRLADARGMYRYVPVIPRTGPARVPDGDAREVMSCAHLAHMERLS